MATGSSTAGPGSNGGVSAAVVAEAVSKRFPTGLVAVDDVSFELAPGAFASIVGPSGCGKSTLLRLVAGLLDITEGTMRLGGTEVSGPRQDAGMMFQDATLLPWRTALENVLLPVSIKRRVTVRDREKAADLLELVGIRDFRHSFPRQLSGGMQQRVALARLLMIGADVLLLDEPFGALDEFTRERLNLELQRIHLEVGLTTMFVTHNIQEAVFLADEVFVMTPGPGRLAAVIHVDLPRPRPISIMKSQEFNDLVFEVRDCFGGAA
jgi:NitT/TauT family transport system ATP-binding protein